MKQGIIYFESGDYENARDIFTKALILKNEDLDARYNLAVCHFKMRDYSKALEEITFILDIYPEDRESRLLYEKIKKQSLEDLQVRISNDPFDEDSYISLARIYIHDREYEKALGILTDASERLSGSASIFDWLATVYQKKGDLKKASEYVEKAFNLAPDDPLIFEHLKMIAAENRRYGSGSDKSHDSKRGVNDIADSYFV
ncbi:MAG: tetratricopeptide repeat protein, partial [Candidatus Muiribacteriaceae bacterium]